MAVISFHVLSLDPSSTTTISQGEADTARNFSTSRKVKRMPPFSKKTGKTTEISGCINILIKPILAEDQLRASVGGCTEVLPWGVAAQSVLAGCCCLTPVLPGRLAW